MRTIRESWRRAVAAVLRRFAIWRIDRETARIDREAARIRAETAELRRELAVRCRASGMSERQVAALLDARTEEEAWRVVLEGKRRYQA